MALHSLSLQVFNMKRFISITSIIICLGYIVSCDKIDNPIPISYDDGLDWTLFPDGDSVNYTWPIWTANSNINQNVLIEDYTGHLCTNCPAAATIATTGVDADINKAVENNILPPPIEEEQILPKEKPIVKKES